MRKNMMRWFYNEKKNKLRNNWWQTADKNYTAVIKKFGS